MSKASYEQLVAWSCPPGTMREILWDIDGLPILHSVELVDFAGVSEEFARVAKGKTRVLFER